MPPTATPLLLPAELSTTERQRREGWKGAGCQWGGPGCTAGGSCTDAGLVPAPWPACGQLSTRPTDVGMN